MQKDNSDQSDPKIRQIISQEYNGNTQQLIDELRSYLRSLNEKSEQPAIEPARDFSNQPIIVKVNNVSYDYHITRKNIVHALKNVSLEIHQGEIVALMGASGSGKSTLMSLIGGLDRPNNGTITVNDQDIGKLSNGQLTKYRNQTVGFVFQFFYLQPFLNLRRNVEVPLMFGRSKRKDRHEPIDRSISAVNLTDRASHKPKELSGGQMQRAAIARAIVNRPKLLLADEPTGNLDSKSGADMMNIFSEIREQFGTTVLIVTHDQNIAGKADRIIYMKDGEITHENP
ncbi:ABC transporter ATP-binding protein [Candidatus Saccharibacteria bacterium]|nr:ABC transporter ATP-binding protein [Candidatus Saccharibacteria bacterium]